MGGQPPVEGDERREFSRRGKELYTDRGDFLRSSSPQKEKKKRRAKGKKQAIFRMFVD